METSGVLSLRRPSGLTGFERIGGGGQDRFLRFSRRCVERRQFPKVDFPDSRSLCPLLRQRHRHDAEWRLLCSSHKSGVAAIKSESFYASIDEAVILKEKAEEVRPYLGGQCIYLVGMMGSGKTTVGKILSEALGYSFFDSDRLVEQAAGGTSVAQIFKEHSEDFFRDCETSVLRDLSSMRRLVVATGGGVVIRPINWRYMKQGITVWLDVPLDALARRIAAVGTASRPLLHQESGDPYTKALNRLRLLWEERGEAYTNADAAVSLQYMAAKQGQGDVNKLTPTAIAVEALVMIGHFLSTSQLERHPSREEV